MGNTFLSKIYYFLQMPDNEFWLYTFLQKDASETCKSSGALLIWQLKKKSNSLAWSRTESVAERA